MGREDLAEAAQISLRVEQLLDGWRRRWRLVMSGTPVRVGTRMEAINVVGNGYIPTMSWGSKLR